MHLIKQRSNFKDAVTCRNNFHGVIITHFHLFNEQQIIKYEVKIQAQSRTGTTLQRDHSYTSNRRMHIFTSIQIYIVNDTHIYASLRNICSYLVFLLPVVPLLHVPSQQHTFYRLLFYEETMYTKLISHDMPSERQSHTKMDGSLGFLNFYPSFVPTALLIPSY